MSPKKSHLIDNYTCPNCKKKAYHLNSDWTGTICDKCGFEVDHTKIPFLKGIVKIMEDMKKAIKMPIDVNDLEEVKDED